MSIFIIKELYIFSVFIFLTCIVQEQQDQILDILSSNSDQLVRLYGDHGSAIVTASTRIRPVRLFDHTALTLFQAMYFQV